MPYKPIMSASEITDFLDQNFPQIHIGGRSYHVEDIGLDARKELCEADGP